jgi:hypothetical protein
MIFWDAGEWSVHILRILQRKSMEMPAPPGLSAEWFVVIGALDKLGVLARKLGA